LNCHIDVTILAGAKKLSGTKTEPDMPVSKKESAIRNDNADKSANEKPHVLNILGKIVNNAEIDKIYNFIDESVKMP